MTDYRKLIRADIKNVLDQMKRDAIEGPEMDWFVEGFYYDGQQWNIQLLFVGDKDLPQYIIGSLRDHYSGKINLDEDSDAFMASDYIEPELVVLGVEDKRGKQYLRSTDYQLFQAMTDYINEQVFSDIFDEQEWNKVVEKWFREKYM